MTSQRARREPLDARRDFWDSREPTATLMDRTGRHDHYSVGLLETPQPVLDPAPGVYVRARKALLRYDIYPPRRMRALVCSPGGTVQSGALIIQRIFVDPFAVEAAVRVVEAFENRESDGATGFTYVTLAGHAEKGVATFFISDSHEGAAGQLLTFNIESWSVSGDGLAKFIAPVARLFQKAFSREALSYFRSSAAGLG